LSFQGLVTLLDSAAKRKKQLLTKVGDTVHLYCRVDYTKRPRSPLDPNAASTSASTPVSDRLRARGTQQTSFDYKNSCVLCANIITRREKENGEISWVGTLLFQDMLHEAIGNVRTEPENCEWNDEVKGRLNFAIDLPAEDALYHRKCHTYFLKGLAKPEEFRNENERPSKQKRGPVQDIVRFNAFRDVASCFVDDYEGVANISHLQDEMAKLLPSGYAPYSHPFMKKQLKEYFGENNLRFVDKTGIVVLNSVCNDIIQKFHSAKRSLDQDQEKLRIVVAAGNLIHDELRCHQKSLSSEPKYPSFADLNPDKMVDELPTFLRVLLSRLLRHKTHRKLRIASIGQAIAQCSRPNTLQMTIPMALGIQLHHSHACRELNDTAFRIGFAVSYTTVQNFERASAVATKDESPKPDPPGTVRQHIADNVDWDPASLDGRGGIHIQGMMSSVTPGVFNSSRRVDKATPSSEQLKQLVAANVKYISSSDINVSTYLKGLKFKKLNHPKTLHHDTCTQLDLLYFCAPLLDHPSYMWSETMALVFTDKDYTGGQSSFEFLPMINMKSTDMNCIYSTMLFVHNDAAKHGGKAVLTMDQPLFHKAIMIATAEGSPFKSIILRLGGFHTLMCFLAAIGDTMENTGLKEAMSVAYAEGSVGHILSGKFTYTAKVSKHSSYTV